MPNEFDGHNGKKMDPDEAWRRKKVEFVEKEASKVLETRQLLKEWIRRSIDEYGNIPLKIRQRVDNVGRDFGITVDEVVEEVMEENVFEKRGSIDHEKLAVLLLQKAQRLREANGGIMTLGEVQLALSKAGNLSGKVGSQDVRRSIEILAERKLIPGFRKLNTGLTIVCFFPIEISPDQNTVLAIAGEKGWTTLEEVMIRTHWSRERADITLKALEDSGLSRLDRSYATGKKWYFPGLSGQYADVT
jgi:hypothetical protein